MEEEGNTHTCKILVSIALAISIAVTVAILTWITLQGGANQLARETAVYDSEDSLDTVAPRQSSEVNEEPYSNRVARPNEPAVFPPSINSTVEAPTMEPIIAARRNDFLTKTSRDNNVGTKHIASQEATLRSTDASSRPLGKRASMATSAMSYNLGAPLQSTPSYEAASPAVEDSTNNLILEAAERTTISVHDQNISSQKVKSDEASSEETTERKVSAAPPRTAVASESASSKVTNPTTMSTMAVENTSFSTAEKTTGKPMEPQILLCTYGAKTNASTVFPSDGLCDFIFFDSVYKNDRNFLADSENIGVDLQHFLAVIPNYSKTAFGVGFAFEYRGTLTQDLTRTDPIPLEVFWKHGVYHFGILDVPVFGLKPFYMDDVFTCLKTLDAMSQGQRDSGKAAYIVLSAVPYNAGWVNYVADKMKTVYRPDLFVSQGHYTYGDNEAITCAVVPPTSLFRPNKLLGYAHDLNTAALALQQLESQGASSRWSISVGMKGRLAAPLPKFPLEIFSPCYQNPVAPAFDTYTEVCNNQQLWHKPAYDNEHDTMLTRNTKMNMMFVYDNEQSLCRKLCRVKANYTKLRFGLAAFDLDYEDYSNSCRQDNKFSAFSRLQTLRKLVDYFKDHFEKRIDEPGCIALVPT
ncbi:uncharacterized protein [Dermacentor albipictus]